jgi:hypothetical protein
MQMVRTALKIPRSATTSERAVKTTNAPRSPHHPLPVPTRLTLLRSTQKRSTTLAITVLMAMITRTSDILARRPGYASRFTFSLLGPICMDPDGFSFLSCPLPFFVDLYPLLIPFSTLLLETYAALSLSSRWLIFSSFKASGDR